MDNTNFAGNYEGPLYAPHPDLIKKAKQSQELREVVEMPGICVETNTKVEIID